MYKFFVFIAASACCLFTDLWQMHFISARMKKKMKENIKPSHFIALSLIEKSSKERQRECAEEETN